uniref:Ribosomal large subunit pseudouridine synthase A put n=1 Tax=Albugo laibachii Nc14 TaxID=890382 RepID=F0WQH1_9STRA|nr:ribosomal large subunit pseudouridine synthase A put [Albugo laibachii Nc14]|eukprot:CCA23580.1 ribosomal large subunit pseudouridine synthase A put [Albugo laibachii Nc14]
MSIRRRCRQISSALEQEILSLELAFITSIGLKHKSELQSKIRYEPQELIPFAVYSSDVGIRCYHALMTRSALAFDAFLTMTCVPFLQKWLEAHLTSFLMIMELQKPSIELQNVSGIKPDRVIYLTVERVVPSIESAALRKQCGVEIHYCDDAIAVVSKPSGMLTVDGKGSQLSLQRQLKKLHGNVWVVHRLDMDTSGLLVVAWSKLAADRLGSQFRDRTIRKVYHARVHGHPNDDEGVISGYMNAQPDERFRQRMVETQTDGKWSQTGWRVLSRSSNPKSSLLELTPVTGRTHQLRVHLSHIGHPILGDEWYAPQHVYKLADRLLLHATALEFVHPLTRKRVHFVDECDF